jgi:hypothetical protein
MKIGVDLKVFGMCCVLLICTVTQIQAAIYTVTSREDSGAGTLRDAIAQANVQPGLDTIQFNVSNSITVYSTLSVSDPVIIEGGGTTLGVNSGALVLLSLVSGSGGSTVRELAVVGGNVGIDLQSDGNTVEGCLVGIDWNNTPRGCGTGVNVAGDNNTIGGGTGLQRNVVSSNTYGVELYGTANNVLNNYIGTNRIGDTGMGNTTALVVYGNGNTIGGSLTSDRNIISSSSSSGISLSGEWNIFQNNYIGINAAGTGILNNGNNAAFLTNDGGNNLFQDNYMADRFYFYNAGSTGNTLVGNKIGILPNGSTSGFTHNSGIFFNMSASGNYAGLPSTGQGNLIVGSSGAGIETYVLSAVQNGYFGNTLVGCGVAGIVNNGNNSKAAPSINSALVNLSISGTAEPNDYIEIFVAENSGNPGTERFVGFTTADGSGNWSLNPGGSVSAGEFVRATATDVANNTSVLSGSLQVVNPTPTSTITPSATTTPTVTITPTATITPTITPTATHSPTLTATPTGSITLTVTQSPTYTVTPTITLTVTATYTITTTQTITVTPYAIDRNDVIAYPSPAKGDTMWFYFQTEGSAQVEIKIYNVVGELSDTVRLTATGTGYQRLPWELESVAPGIYFYRMSIDDAGGIRKFDTKKFVVIK